MPEQPSPSQDDGRIIPFRPRNAPRSGWRWPVQRSRPSEPPVKDLSKYEGGQGEDDYRHRMTVNVLALAVTSVLVVSGVWLAVSIADMRKNQDCYLAGGRNCDRLLIPKAQP